MAMDLLRRLQGKDLTDPLNRLILVGTKMIRTA
jgi:hypothetical protein